MKKEGTETSMMVLLPPREEMERELMDMFFVHGPAFSTNVDTYLSLLEIKKDKGIYPINAIKKDELVEYPRIEFMELRSDIEASKYLSALSKPELYRLMRKIEEALNSYIYVTIMNRIKDYRVEIARNEVGRQNSFCGLDPDRLRNKGNICKRATRNTETT